VRDGSGSHPFSGCCGTPLHSNRHRAQRLAMKVSKLEQGGNVGSLAILTARHQNIYRNCVFPDQVQTKGRTPKMENRQMNVMVGEFLTQGSNFDCPGAKRLKSLRRKGDKGDGMGQRKLVAWVNSVSAPTCGASSLSDWPAKRPLEPKLSLDPRLLSWAR